MGIPLYFRLVIKFLVSRLSFVALSDVTLGHTLLSSRSISQLLHPRFSHYALGFVLGHPHSV